ncbi:MAG TPA: 16S rRNA (cytosine(1402)-N(4))-methyltransferase RsmH [Fibrobacteria bacterium]|nr:16S rRNA (cytosine(1402)-N(4))-methyltransferase RsmH [Fibrobacteria bacterium]
MTDYHRPVLEQEVADFLVRDASAAYLDATLGGGGHTRALLARLAPAGRLTALDRDPEAIAQCRDLIENDGRLTVHLAPFSRIATYCPPASLAGALFDLGVSSHQLDARGRGFSFEPGSPLDMRMGPDAEISALEWLQAASAEDLARAFHFNSDLDRSRPLARRVKELLAAVPSSGTPGSELLRQAVQDVLRPRDNERAGLLARVFQAIRMEVNREADEIRVGLSAAVAALASGGRVCVLSYHSVEDRKVKEVFAELEKDCVCPHELPVCRCGGNRRVLRKVVRRPLEASSAEIAANPRARSAKLRVMEKV